MAENNPAILEGNRLKKYFSVTSGLIKEKITGVIKALDDVDISLHTQETVGLVGESGSGKTTLGKIFLCLDRPTEGDVFFKGKNLYALTKPETRTYRRKVQAVFQDPFSSLSPRLRIRDIICEPMEEAGIDKKTREIRVDETLRMVGLKQNMKDLFPHEISGGQRQRVAIARAISTEADVIILDEPTSALDVSVRLQIVHLLMKLQEELGLTYLLIGHDLAMVAYMSTHIAVLYLGKIVEFGEAREILQETLHPYTKALIAASLPDHPRFKKGRISVSGEIANPLNLPSGCRFHPRCPVKKSICSNQEPVVVSRETHSVACHLLARNS
jgi:oligopeptide/dipeptide ABC transporter ATP-binding protein